MTDGLAASTIGGGLASGVASSERGARVRFDASEFMANYNRRPFYFSHELAGEPALAPDAVRELALRLDQGHVRHHFSNLPLTADFMTAGEQYPMPISLAEAIDRLDEINGYVLIANAQADAAFGRFFRDLMDELRPGFNAIDPGVHEEVAYLFLSSPGAMTPFHLDREVNFLCQIRGEKEVHLFDPADRTVLSEQALDNVLLHPYAPRPVYQESFEASASVWHLRPGMGVHHPYLAPHWVRNGGQVSVSLALTYRTRATERQVRVRSFNGLMRHAGVRPRPFGEQPRLDSLKGAAYGMFQPLRPMLAKLRARG